MGKPRAYRRRVEAIRVPRKTTIILTEGTKTEIFYFNHFRTRKSGISVTPSNHRDALGIVNEAKRLKRLKELSPPDEIYCVYDIDQNTQEQLTIAVNFARKDPVIRIFPSNPSFEIWFLFHFIAVRKRMNPDEVFTELKSYFPSYEKETDFLANLVRISTDTEFITSSTRAFYFSQTIASALSEDDIFFGQNIACTEIHRLIQKLVENENLNVPDDLEEYFRNIYQQSSMRM